MQTVYRQFRRLARGLLMLCGAVLLLQLALPVTGLQGRWARWLAPLEYALEREPAYIVVLGGGGIPSESGLIRLWYGARAASEYPDATVIVALPSDDDPEEASVGRMKQELILRGIDERRILMETRGRNTHEQAVNVRAMLGDDAEREPILIVTSSYHLRRSILCFRTAGFDEVGVRPAISVGVEADIGRWSYLRYGFWQSLADQWTYAREMLALIVYRLRGWI